MQKHYCLLLLCFMLAAPALMAASKAAAQQREIPHKALSLLAEGNQKEALALAVKLPSGTLAQLTCSHDCFFTLFKEKLCTEWHTSDYLLLLHRIIMTFNSIRLIAYYCPTLRSKCRSLIFTIADAVKKYVSKDDHTKYVLPNSQSALKILDALEAGKAVRIPATIPFAGKVTPGKARTLPSP